MSAYAQSLADFSLESLWNQAKEGITTAGNELVGKAETATSEAAAGLVRQGGDAVSREINKLVGGGGGGSTPQPPLPAQKAETPVETPGSTLSGLSRYAIPAGVGVGVYFWQKSIVWAGVAAVAAYFIAAKMRKGGK